LHQALAVIEEKLGEMFQPEFAKSILMKQLTDIDEVPETFTDAMVEPLLNQIEKKVLVSFYGDKAKGIVADLKRAIKAATDVKL
jgi:hypothetical protein